MRLFVAIWPGDQLRKSLRGLQDGLRNRCPDVRWTPPEQLHITVKFLGEVEDRRVPEIVAGLEKATASCKPFDLRVVNAGCFPPRGDVRIVWAGVEDAAGVVAGCAGVVDGALEVVGFARESRAFSAHITIGRVREDRSSGRLREIVESAKWGPQVQEISEIRLMSSVLSPRGSVYDTVAAIPLNE